MQRFGRYTTVTLMLAIGGCAELEVGELGASEHALAGSATSYWEDNELGDDPWGRSMASDFDRTCFLSGVAGNLGSGTLWDVVTAWSNARGSAAVRVGTGNALQEGPVLYARGGFHLDSHNQPVWDGNAVAGLATCVAFPASKAVYIGSFSDPFDGYKAKYIMPEANKRQCFLSGLEGGDGSWNYGYARVERRMVARSIGWYLEADIPHHGNGIWPSVHAVCIDFPQDTVITSGTVVGDLPGEKVVTIAPPSSILDRTACGLTSIEGSLNVDDRGNGAIMLTPSQTGDQSWKLVVSHGKTASWACAR